MTVIHADGSTCMADFWEQSAKLVAARAEKAEELARDYESIIETLWEMLPEPPPLRPEFKARLDALIAAIPNRTKGGQE